MPTEEWFTIAEACQVLKVSRRSLYAHMQKGLLPFYQAGGSGHRRIRAEDLELLMVPAAGSNGQAITGVRERLGRPMAADERKALINALEWERQERQKRDEELQELRPLKVWADLPCAHCGKPLRGVVKREVAEALLRKFVHPQCLEERRKGQWFPLNFTFLERPVQEAE